MMMEFQDRDGQPLMLDTDGVRQIKSVPPLIPTKGKGDPIPLSEVYSCHSPTFAVRGTPREVWARIEAERDKAREGDRALREAFMAENRASLDATRAETAQLLSTLQEIALRFSQASAPRTTTGESPAQPDASPVGA